MFTDGIFVTDVGQHQMWTTQFLEMNKNKQLITSGGLGTMGFGLPAAIGAINVTVQSYIIYNINFVPQFGQKLDPALFGVPQFGQNLATLPP